MKRTTTNLNSCDPIIPASVSPLHLKWQTLYQVTFFYMMPGYTRMDTSAPYNRKRSTENPIHGIPIHELPNGLPVFMGKSQNILHIQRGDKELLLNFNFHVSVTQHYHLGEHFRNS